MGTLIEKNAIVAIIQATNINSKPMKNRIVKMAPTKRSVLAVSNMCSPYFWAIVLNDFLKFIAANT